MIKVARLFHRLKKKVALRVVWESRCVANMFVKTVITWL